LRESDNRLLEWQGGEDLRSFYEAQWWSHHTGEAFVLVADFNGFPIGQAAIYWVGKPIHPHLPDLQSLRVHPIFQGQGIGTRLLEAGALATKARGLPQLSLSVGGDNHRARRLYERCGFRITGEAYEDSWSYTNAAGQKVTVTEIVMDMLKEL
jgi:ribosomal protein S18 acetylase RimI-like enzyme